MTRHTTRETTARTKNYRPPSMLDAPAAPEGVVYRWVRVATRNEDDLKNVAQRRRDGWEFVQGAEHKDFASHEEGRYAGVIGSGDVVLMKNSAENVEARNEYYANLTRRQQAAVDAELMKNQHPSMPIMRDSQSEVTRGKRRDVEIDD